MHTVFAGDHNFVGFSAFIDTLVYRGIDDITRIEDPHEVFTARRRTVVNPCRAGEHTVLILINIRGECNALIAPVQEIFTGAVSPVLELVLGPLGSVLIEGMVGAVEFAKTVGVIEPTVARLKMQVRVPKRCGHHAPLVVTVCRTQHISEYCTSCNAHIIFAQKCHDTPCVSWHFSLTNLEISNF